MNGRYENGPGVLKVRQEKKVNTKMKAKHLEGA
jgi:hypothetical protein